MRLMIRAGLLLACLPALAQMPQGIDLQALKQAAGAQGDVTTVDAVPKKPTTLPATAAAEPSPRQRSEEELSLIHI